MKELNSSKIKQLFKNKTTEQKIAEVFFRYPYREFTLSEIAKLAKVSKSRASSILNAMSQNNFIILERLGKKFWRIRANIENFEFKKRKIVYNLETIYSSGIVEFLEEHFKNPKAIILFGSFREGEDGTDSDIDIAVEILENKKFKIMRFKEFENIEKSLGRKIKIHVFNRKNIDDNVFVNIANGIVLYGFLEVKK